MSVTLDANILVYASDASSPYQEPATGLLQGLAEGSGLFYVFWPVLMGYLRIVTHPSIMNSPLPPEAAVRNVESLLRLPHARTGGESDRFWEVWRATVAAGLPRGNAVPDSHLVALMHEHGVRTIYSRDRALRRFDGIDVVDPFEQSA